MNLVSVLRKIILSFKKQVSVDIIEVYYFLKFDRGCNDSVLATLNRQSVMVSKYNIKQDILYRFCYENLITKKQKDTFRKYNPRISAKTL